MAIVLRGVLPVHSPEWWLRRLLSELFWRRREIDELARFHDGQQPLMFASEQFAETFGSRYRRLPANFMPRVVDAERERLIVTGFRFGEDPRSDRDLWRIWQDNQLDAESMIAHEIALVKGLAYTLVQPPGVEDTAPVVTIEDPTETIVEHAAGNRRKRAAALKAWIDDEAFLRAYVYLPEAVYKYRSEKPVPDRIEGWPAPSMVVQDDHPLNFERFQGGDPDWPLPNPLGVVPVIPLINRPRRDGTGRSEIVPVMGNQSAINKLRFDALVAAEAVAFPQRWFTNIDIPIGDDGKPISPFKPGIHNLWGVRKPTPEEAAQYGDKVPQPSFGQFPAASLSPYIDMIREEVVEMASISGTPYYQLVGPPTSVAPSGESIKSSEASLVKKADTQAIYFGEGWEETMRLVAVAADRSDLNRTDGETMWADRETRNEAARTDSILKQVAAGLIPDEFALEELGYSQQEILRIKELREQALLEAPEPAAPTVVDRTAAGGFGFQPSVLPGGRTA